ncbi:MAG TPA: SDR family oxidoreductase [Burkholderiaceae bacterium]|nr:SDR family oxidoreductase [Burkholderiaceae bacterium]
MLIQDKVCIVTGAGSGIGRAIAIAFGREGGRVVVSDVDEKGGAGTVELLKQAGAAAGFVAADVSRAADCERLVKEAVSRFGRLDIACNNAGIGGDLAPAADYPLEGWDRVIGINLTGVFLCMKYQLPELVKTRGSIVNIASILGQVGFGNAPAYTAAKHGVLGLTKATALDYAAAGVRVNAIAPAFIHTPMISGLESDEATRSQLVALHPAGRLGTPEEVAELALWLASPRASFVTGSCYAVDGGYLAR